MSFLDALQLFDYPYIGAAEKLRRRLVDDIRRAHLQDAQARRVAGNDFLGLVQRKHATRHRFEHALVVVLHVLHVGEQLGVLQCNRNLRRKRLQPRLVFVGERAAALVQHLGYADDTAALVDDGHAQDGAREITGLLVERRIETQVRVRVRDVDRLASGEHRAGDTDVVGQADLHRFQPLADFRPELIGLLVVEEQRRSLGVQHTRRFAHDLLQQRTDLDVGSDFRHDVEEFELLLADRLHALNELRALQRQSALRRHRHQQLQIAAVKRALLLVQHLCDAYDVAFRRAYRHAQYAARHEPGLLVDGAVEARIGVRVVDDDPFTAGEHVAGNAAVVEQADFAVEITLRHARVQLVGFRIVQEQRAAFRGKFIGRDLDQPCQHFIE